MKGVIHWNEWYGYQDPERKAVVATGRVTRIDLSGADLHGKDFGGVNLFSANLNHVNLRECELTGANLHSGMLNDAMLGGADLSRANLSSASLRHADLKGAKLTDATARRANLNLAHLENSALDGVDLRDSNLDQAYLIQSSLRNAKLCRATLLWTNLAGSLLTRSDLTGALLSETIIADVDLSEVVGLETCSHYAASTLDHRTLARSGSLPLAFLRGCGLPEALITYLPSILTQPIQFYSCFISYSMKDQEFAERLHADLQNKGVRCWFAPHDIKGGRKIHEQIDEAIRVYDRLLLILSEFSMASEWVKTEIAHAGQKEVDQKRQVLFPISLVPFTAIRDWKCF